MKNQKLRVDNLKHGYLFLIVSIFFTIKVIMFRKILGEQVMSEWNPELYDNEQFIERDL